MTLLFPEKEPSQCEAQLKIDCIMFDKSFLSLNLKKRFDVLVQVRTGYRFSDVVFIL